MKKLIYILSLGFLIIASSCSDYLDINKDPNNPSDAGANLIMPAGQASVVVTTSGIYNNLGGFLAQYWTQAVTANQYNDLDQYLLKTDDYENQWDELYSGGLNDLEFIRKQFEEAGDWGNNLVAVTMQSYAYQLLVDLHDKIPYSQALNPGEYLNPEWDNGQDVYAAILSNLTDAINMAKGDATASIYSEDLLLGGDVQAWIQFANSLKLKILMRQSDVVDVSADVKALLGENNFLTQSVAMTQFQDEENKRNPWYEVQVDRLSGGGDFSINHIACYSLAQFLNSNGDPRLQGIYQPAADDSEFGSYGSNYPGASKTGTRSADASSDDSYARVNILNLAPAYIMILPEVHFLIAEAALKYNSDDVVAKANYEAGIDASVAMHGLGSASFLYQPTGPYAWDSGKSMEDRLKDIYMQRWIGFAKFMGIEAWNELRRTDWPERVAYDYSAGDPEVGKLTAPRQNKLGDGLFVNRLWYPESERSANINSPDQPADLTAKVWWDVN